VERHQDEGPAGRFYTHARRYPLVIGKLGGPGQGGQLPGGPYTLPQVGVFVALVLALSQTRGLWAHFGGVGNVIVGVGVPAALAWAIRRARIDGRSPAAALRGLLRYACAPSGGRRSGRAWRPGRPHRVRGLAWVQAPDLLDEPAPAPAAAGPASRAPAGRPGGGRRPATALEQLLAAAVEA